MRLKDHELAGSLQLSTMIMLVATIVATLLIRPSLAVDESRHFDSYDAAYYPFHHRQNEPMMYEASYQQSNSFLEDDRRRELQVMQHLLAAGYTYYTRPLTENNETLEVRIRVSIIKIQNLWERTDVKTEALETTMRIQLNWCDDMLSWEPGDFGGVESVIIPGDRLWIPDIQIINALDDVYTLTRDRRFDFKLHSDGCVWWYPTGTTLTRCQLDLQYFPFDIQVCNIIFESAMYPKEYLNLTMRYDKRAVSLKTFTENGQWELLSVEALPKLNYVTESTSFTRVEIILRMGRKTLYYQMNVLCPCGMLSALQILTFLLPIGSEDRISQSTTVLLSFVVFQSVAVAELPRTSTSVPLLCLYIDFLTGVSVVTVTNAILNVYFMKTTEQTRLYKQVSLVHWLKKKIRKRWQKFRGRVEEEEADYDDRPLDTLGTDMITTRGPQPADEPEASFTPKRVQRRRSIFHNYKADRRVSVGTVVNENDIFDEDSLNPDSTPTDDASASKDGTPVKTAKPTLNGSCQGNGGRIFATRTSAEAFNEATESNTLYNQFGTRVNGNKDRRDQGSGEQSYVQNMGRRSIRQAPAMRSYSLRTTAQHLAGTYVHGIHPSTGSVAAIAKQVAENYRARKRDKMWRTITVYVDTIVFILAFSSSIFVPFYMFSILPPAREPLRTYYP